LERAGGGQNKLPFEKHYSKISFEGLSPSGGGRGRENILQLEKKY
jgi:hypothetical protein